MHQSDTELPAYHLVYLRIRITFLLLSFSILLNAQLSIQWSYPYGGTKNDIPSAMQKTVDGGFIITGRTGSSDGTVTQNYGGFDAWVVNLDNNGIVLWEKNYGGSADDYLANIQLTDDGGYILVGGSSSNDIDLDNNNGGNDIWVLKINATGNIQWSKTFGGSGVDFGTSITTTNDGGYVLSACTGSGGEPGLPAGAGGNDFLVIKLSSSGNVDWQKIYGGKRHDGAKTILQTSDGGYLVGGTTWSQDGDVLLNNGHGDSWVVKTNATGDIQWSKTFGGVTTDKMSNMIASDDGNYVMVGTYAIMTLTGNGFPSRYNEDFWMIKFDPDGTLLWEKNYGSSKYDEAKSVIETADGGYLLGGFANSGDVDVSNNNGHKDQWVVKTNSVGDIEWERSLGGSENEEIVALAEIVADEYLLVGYSNSVFVDTVFETHGLEDWWALKLGDTNTSIFLNLGNDLTLCADEEFELNASNPNCTCTYIWNDGNTDPQRILSLSSSAVYSVTVTDANGASLSDEVSITISTPEVSSIITEVDCYGNNSGAINLTPSGNYTYLWNNNLDTEDLQNLTAGAYTVTVTDGLDCEIEETFTIPEPDETSFNEVVTEVSCFGGQDGMINLNPTGGTGNYSYNWSGSSNSTSQDISGLGVGTYTVVIEDANNCTTTNTWTITEPDQLSVGLIPSPTSCFDSEDGAVQINVNGGTGNKTYLWSNGMVTPELSGVTSGTYTLTVTDTNFCEAIETVFIGSPDMIQVDETITLASCFGNDDGAISTVSSGGVGNYSYLWSTGGMTANLSDIMAGTYTLTVTDGYMCEHVEEFVVSQNTDLEVSSEIMQVSCYGGNNGSIDITPSGGSGSYEYLWSNNEMTQNINELLAGDYILTMTDGNGCQEIQAFTIEEPDEIMIFPTVTEVSCYGGNDGSITIDVTGGVGGYLLDWSSSGSMGLAVGTYTVTVTDENFCEQTEEIIVPEPDSLYATLDVVNPLNGNDGMITATAVGGVPPYDFNWNSSMYSGDQITNLEGGVYQLTLTDNNGCTFNVTVLLETISVDEIESLQAFGIFPNPTESEFFLELEFSKKEKINIVITNELGQDIHSFFMEGKSILKNINFLNLSSGLYFISVKTEKGNAVKRFVVID